MKTKSTLVLWLCLLALTGVAQNQITTPSGQPLVIGNQGVKLSNLNSSSATQPTNGKVLSVDANGLIFLAPDASGAPSQFTNNGANIYFNTGNVGLGTNTPLQRLDVNGSINIPTGNGIRINNVSFLSAPGSNIFMGAAAGVSSTTATGNLFIGSSSGTNTVGGSNNAFLGYQAGKLNVSGSNNMFLGTNAGENNFASNNTFIGANAGRANTNGTYNFFAGTNAGSSNQTANNNTFVGGSAGISNTDGSGNVFIGTSSGYLNQSGSNNMFLGTGSGYNSTGNSNVFIGSNAGSNNTSGSQNTFIGNDAKATSATLQNATAIGYSSRVATNNSLVLGAVGVNQVNVGIGNISPSARLHVTAGGTTSTGVRFEGLPTASGTIYDLFVDANGNIMKSSTANARESIEITDRYWTLTPEEQLINTNPGGIIIGKGLSTTPTGYKLYVADGILTERIKVAVKSTSDWRDNVLMDGYKLRSLKEVELFIKQNKHLPGVPSAVEMVTNGNDLHKTDAILLEKVEELMLYIIELKNENSELRADLNEQRQATQLALQNFFSVKKNSLYRKAK